MTKNIGARLRKAGLADRLFLRLSERWALAYNKNQWILQRRMTPGKKGGECRWAAVSFVASNKDILWRVLGEHGVVVTPEAKAAIDAMPHQFVDWLAERDASAADAGAAPAQEAA